MNLQKEIEEYQELQKNMAEKRKKIQSLLDSVPDKKLDEESETKPQLLTEG